MHFHKNTEAASASTCLHAEQSLVCLCHWLRSCCLVNLGSRSEEEAPPAQPTSPPAFSCSHLLNATTPLHMQEWQINSKAAANIVKG